ncbi:MAG: creatininase family protein [Oscillospiraceae bacterium]|nr:creatininase family protein [Oscillospiraceae bacterium]
MRLIHMSGPEIEAYFKENDTVLFAMGSIENHGVHNCLGVDTLIPNRILELVEAQCDILIAPTLPYGTSEPLVGYPGTISLGDDLFYGVVNRVVECLHLYGAKKVLFLNGHDMNIPVLERVGLEWYDRGVVVAHISWWTALPAINPNWSGGHGGAVETSAMLAIDPSLVDLSKAGPPGLINDLGDELPSCGLKNVMFQGVEVPVCRPMRHFAPNGWCGPLGRPDDDHPEKSNAAWGQEMLDATAKYIAEFLEVFKRVKL